MGGGGGYEDGEVLTVHIHAEYKVVKTSIKEFNFYENDQWVAKQNV